MSRPLPSVANSVGAPSPEPEGALVALAHQLVFAGELGEAVEAYEQALELAPHRADLLAELGNLWQERNDPQAALDCYRRAVRIDPDSISARQNLGYLLGNLGEAELALEQYDEVLARWPSPLSQVLAATVLPVIYDSRASVQSWRQRFATQVERLVAAGLQVDTTRSQIPTNFLLAYQGENDRELAGMLGQIYRGCHLVEPGRRGRDRRDDRLRVGFLSAFFRDHTIGRLNLGTMELLPRDRFEVIVLSAGTIDDDWSAAFARAADQYRIVPRNVEHARQRIASEQLDVLCFADVGMDAITSTLVHSRMAPIQTCTWGHPDTTGSSAIDVFLSSESLETPEADDHYTERLFRSPTLNTVYHRPRLEGPVPPREHFGFDPEQHIYLCPQTLYKLHPDFDEVLARILQQDPHGYLVLLEGRISQWTERLRRRFQRTLPNGGARVRFLPGQSYPHFLALLAAADVILDPLYFSGGNTSYEAFAMQTPIVTWPGRFMRGRVTFALYQKMGIDDLIVHSIDEYVTLAVRIASEPAFRQGLRQRIGQRNDRLFHDRQDLRGLETFLDACREGRALAPDHGV